MRLLSVRVRAIFLSFSQRRYSPTFSCRDLSYFQFTSIESISIHYQTARVRVSRSRVLIRRL